MKAFIVPTYTFTPGASGVGTVDLSNIPSFDIKRLLAVINQTTGTVIYSTASPSKRYTDVTDGVVTLFYDTSAMDSRDILQVVYEAEDTYATSVKQDLEKAVLDSILEKLEASIAVTGTFYPATQPVSGTVSVDNFPSTVLTPSYQEDLTVTTTPETFTAPANAKYCKIMADGENTDNLKIKLGGTASTTSGITLEPGRSEDFHVAGDISYCSVASTGTNKIFVIFGV